MTTHVASEQRARDRACCVAFDSDLGWMAVAGWDATVWGLTMGNRSASEALEQLEKRVGVRLGYGEWCPRLVERLKAFAAGTWDDFLDVQVELGARTRFQSGVFEACRRIPPGETRTYGELAEEAGRPRAARAVGNVMASNKIPLIVPCHRVVAAGGRLGGFSARQGVALKRRLLELEQQLALEPAGV